MGLAVPEGYLNTSPERANLGVQLDQFYLCVGRLNVRKNLEFVISALRSAKKISANFPLVIVGQPEGLTGQGVTDMIDDVHKDLIFAGFIPDSELKWLYQNCQAFIFASLDEGFGLPILEAELSGSPSVLSDIKAFREVSRNPRTRFFNPRSAESLIDALDQLPEVGDREVDNHSSYSWTRTVRKIRELIE
ncbi:glycosyltransferase [Rhodococcus sp. NPDC078407]|uniref:glycosyltransferase n=1 Tax=Rhodococcus sp. NPDC078407 TaxID=3364509 RepID=UPI0037CBB7F9